MNDLSISWSSYQTIIYVWIGLAIAVFFLLLRITAPYGRHASAKWGPQVSNNFGWFLMEIPVLIVLGIFIFPVLKSITTATLIMTSLFCFHYFYRSLIFPFRLHTRGKKMPWVIVGSGIFFNIITGLSLGYFFIHFAQYSNEWFLDWRFILGAMLFIAGLYINWKADEKLISLRKPDETDYKIPRGWLFEKISCPNLFGEILEWAGFAILCWNLPALAFFIWTSANLIPRAISHHRWYKEKFPGYPENRKAILPFIL